LREPSPTLPRPGAPAPDEDLFRERDAGPLVLPGKYRVRLLLRQRGKTHGIEGEQAFQVALYGEGKGKGDRRAILVFQQKVTALKRAVAGTLLVANDLEKRLAEINRAIDQTPGTTAKDHTRVHALRQRLNNILRHLRGDVAL